MITKFNQLKNGMVLFQAEADLKTNKPVLKQFVVVNTDHIGSAKIQHKNGDELLITSTLEGLVPRFAENKAEAMDYYNYSIDNLYDQIYTEAQQYDFDELFDAVIDVYYGEDVQIGRSQRELKQLVCDLFTPTLPLKDLDYSYLVDALTAITVPYLKFTME